MKRYRIIVTACILILAVSLLSGCGRSAFSVKMNADNSITITAVRAPKNSIGSTGGLYVGRNEIVVVEPAIEGDGQIQVRLMVGLPGSDAYEKEPVFLKKISGNKPVELEVPLGEYSFEAKVLEKTTGTAKVTVKRR